MKVNRILLILILILPLVAWSQNQIKLTNLDVSKLPPEIKYEGKIKNAVQWTDELGINIVVISETGIYKSEKFTHEDEGMDAELFAYHFLDSDGMLIDVWKVYDFISDCPVDIEASFIKNTLQVTDLNKDKIAEVWLMYKTVCHGDVSPSDMKIIMYQGNQKYAMRGQNKVNAGTDESGKETFIGGDFKFDKAFKSGPAEFRTFATNLWNQNIMQKWEE